MSNANAKTNSNSTGHARPINDRPDYLSAKEAAELLGVNRATVINWAHQGRFGGYQFGQRGIYRFDRQEILDYINRSRLRAAADPDRRE